MPGDQASWDLFISHAAEDKKSVAKPLADALTAFGLHVWYDEFTLRLGDSLSRSIDKGLAGANYGVVILSPAFFAKSWPEYELRGLTAKEIGGSKVIIPIWHNVDREDVLRFSPPLADKLAIKSKGRSAAELAVAIIEVTNPDLFEKVHLRAKFLAATERAKTITIDPKKIAPAPLRHKKLPGDLVSRIRLIRAALLGIHTHSMKCWLSGFQRDTHPSREILVWERICAALHEYLAMNRLSSRQVQHVFTVALGIANGSNEIKLSKHLKGLPPGAYSAIEALMAHDLPSYDVDDCCEFAKLPDDYAIRPNEDRELFPVDLPNELVREIKSDKNKP